MLVDRSEMGAAYRGLPSWPIRLLCRTARIFQKLVPGGDLGHGEAVSGRDCIQILVTPASVAVRAIGVARCGRTCVLELLTSIAPHHTIETQSSREVLSRQREQSTQAVGLAASLIDAPRIHRGPVSEYARCLHKVAIVGSLGGEWDRAI